MFPIFKRFTIQLGKQTCKQITTIQCTNRVIFRTLWEQINKTKLLIVSLNLNLWINLQKANLKVGGTQNLLVKGNDMTRDYPWAS